MTLSCEDNNGVVRYNDVGYAELGADNEESVSRKNNVPSVNHGCNRTAGK